MNNTQKELIAEFLEAARTGKLSQVMKALSDGINVDAMHVYTDKQTALHLAAREGNIDVIELLISSGADINKNTFFGTPLFIAIESGKRDAAKVLLERGADPNLVKPQYRQTCLRIVIENGDLDMVNDLIEAGADVNKQGYDGYSALHWAVIKNYPEIVDALLEADAKTNLTTTHGYDPWDLAINKGHIKCNKVLIKHIVLGSPEASKPDDVTNNPKLSEYWDSQVKKEIFLLNNQGIFNQMSEHFVISRDESDNPIYYAINRDKSLDSLISDAEKFLEETQEKLGIVINPAEFIEYRVEKRYFPSLKALTFGNVPFKCYEELSGGILDDPNVEQSKVGKAIG